MGRNAGVGAEHDRNATRVGPGKRLGNDGSDCCCFGADKLREETVNRCFLSDPVASENRWHEHGAALDHQVHDLFRHVGAVFDGRDAGQHCTFHAFRTVRVRGNPQAIVGCGVDDCLQFLHGELRVLAALGDTQYAAGCRDLDPVRSIFVALPNRLACILDAIDHALFRSGVGAEVRCPAISRVTVTAGRRQSFACRENHRAGHIARGDRFSQCNRDIEGIADVANDRKAGLKCPFRVVGGVKCVIGLIEYETIEIAVGRILTGQVHMGIYQARHDRRVSKVDDRVARVCLCKAVLDAQDDVATDANGPVIDGAISVAVDQAAGVNQCVGGGGSRGQYDGGGQQYQFLHSIISVILFVLLSRQVPPARCQC